MGVTVDELDRAGRRAVMIGFLWRGLVINMLTIIVAGISGALIGLIFAAITGAFGVEQTELRWLSTTTAGIAGLFIGLAFLWQYIRWLFRVRFGEFQLRLVRADVVQKPAQAGSAV